MINKARTLGVAVGCESGSMAGVVEAIQRVIVRHRNRVMAYPVVTEWRGRAPARFDVFPILLAAQFDLQQATAGFSRILIHLPFQFTLDYAVLPWNYSSSVWIRLGTVVSFGGGAFLRLLA